MQIKYLSIMCICLASYANFATAQVISTIFGDVEENEPLIIELLNHKSVQRLKGIDQSGPPAYFSNGFPRFSRYDHSLGVYALLKKYNVSKEEQIAGLMHDTSHTVFSHLADYILQEKSEHTESYQDSIHDQFLTNIGVKSLLDKYEVTLEEISPKNIKFLALEQPLPEMNADRIEYNLHTAKIFSDFSQSDIDEVFNALQFKDGKWYFSSIVPAKKFAKLSNYYTRTFWGSPHNAATYVITSAAIQYAIQHEIIQKQDLQFGMDIDILQKLTNCKDQVIKDALAILKNIDGYYSITETNDFDAYFSVKMRGIDPMVFSNGKLQPLSSLSIDFKQDLQDTARHAKNGIKLQFINIKNPVLLAVVKQNFH